MYSVSDETRKPIFEGVQGENESREIQFDISSWIEELGEGACTATAKRPTDTIPYPVTVTRSGNVVTWKPNSVDTAIEGIGAFQLEYSINGSIAKTRIWNTKIAPSLDPAGDPPDPYDNWLAEMRSIEANAIQAADDAEDSADAAAASAASIDKAYYATKYPIGLEIGVNRYIYQNQIIKANDPARASTAPSVKRISRFMLSAKPSYTVGVITYSNGVWGVSGTYTGDNEIVLADDVEFFYFQVIANSTIPQDADPLSVYYNFYDYIEYISVGEQICKNLIGMQETLYRVDGLGEGVSLTMSTSDGAPVGPGGDGTYVELRFYDENKRYLNYYSFQSNTPVRTVTLPASLEGAKYMSWGNNPRTALQVEFGKEKTEYVPFYKSLRELTNDVYENGSSVSDIHEKAKEEAYIIKKSYGIDGPTDNGFKALWISDLHGEAKRTDRAVELMNDWGGGYFDIAINTGDTVPLVYGDDITWYNNAVAQSNTRVLNVVGNHDAWLSLNGDLAPQTDVYTKFIAPVAASASITQPTGAAASGLNYYYKDLGGVRVIVLDCMYWDAAQLSWFESVLSDAKTNSLPVIACSHAPFASWECTLADSIWNVGWFSRDSTVTNIAAAQAVKDFMDGGGVFICWLQGHIHGDEIDLLPSYGNQIAICTNSFQNRGTKCVKNDNDKAYNYDSLTYITVDTVNKSVKMFRIGANIDTAGHKRNGFVWDYENKRIVTEW